MKHLIAAVALLCATSLVASESITETGEPWAVRGSESFVFDSKHVGDRLAVGVARPNAEYLSAFGHEADAPLQVVYLLDGSWFLNIAGGLANLQLVDLVKPGFPPLLLVGIDYVEGDVNARSRDYVMEDAVHPSMVESLNASPKTAPGGAANFLKFIEEELDPFIRQRYSTAGTTAGIMGDSFGGTFTFYAFLKQSPLFDKYWLGSPGIFTTDADYVAQFAEVLKGELVNDTRMYLSFGELEMNGGVSFYEDMGVQFNRMNSLLNQNPNSRLEWRSSVYPGHTHTTILAPAMNDALLYLYGPHQP